MHAGADPTKLVEDLAKRKKIKTLGVSMGQGQEIIARRYLATATAEGQWLLLQNTHLGLAYLSEACTWTQSHLEQSCRIVRSFSQLPLPIQACCKQEERHCSSRSASVCSRHIAAGLDFWPGACGRNDRP